MKDRDVRPETEDSARHFSLTVNTENQKVSVGMEKNQEQLLRDE